MGPVLCLLCCRPNWRSLHLSKNVP